ncbi:ABC transporter ATP-binding protein [Mobiluncus mulieris]|uniref:ABC transporter ATP-binding protein n=1 Tax=Mobiluncus mulieris TaxID=2052 RepID=UPI00146FEE7A|nr:ABC transporter ATP-binding protein [Mobiluncus mulieris]MCV0009851.1 ABC transporter ATP-binding protein [Mobiluncus mulieris]NMX02175.1 ABC transporter ATP-binding protein [Mobiluncus mulieris]NMX20651.1 ABC transporter ATP-binding protein [Mobiluncus mulieris]
MKNDVLTTEFDQTGTRITFRSIFTPILRLIPFISHFKADFAITLFTMMAYQLSNAVVPALSAWLVSIIVRENTADDSVMQLFFYLGIAIFFSGLFMWLNSWYAHLLSYKIIARLRINVYNAIARINPRGLQNKRSGDIATAGMADLETTEWFYAHTIADFISALSCSLIISIPLILIIGPQGLIPIPLGWLILFIPIVTLRIQMHQGANLRSSLSELKAASLESVQGLRDILSLGLSDKLIEQTRQNTRNVQKANRSYSIRAGLEKSIEDIVVAITSIGMLVLMLRAASASELEVQFIPVAQVLVTSVCVVNVKVAGMLRRIGEISAASKRFLVLNDAPAHIVKPSNPQPLPPATDPSIEFKNVSFTYPAGSEVITDLNLTLPKGKIVALVGASGAGKSTITSLLLRLWDVDSGEIRLNGENIANLALTDLRNEITLVSQTPYIFRETVRYNLALANQDATEEQMWDALHDALLDDVIKALPKSLDTILGERASNLSGGQQQRLNLAQAFLRNTPILVMDEAVSHLDSQLEAKLNQVTAKLRQHRTTLVIAHRLSTIEQSNYVALLDNGRVRGFDTHENLLANDTRYAEILASQMAPDN